MKKCVKRLKVISAKIFADLMRNKKVYISIGVTFGYAAVASILLDPSMAFADIDSKGHMIHRKIVSVGKWIIAGKGSIEIIQSALDGDYQSAKIKFIGYLISFAAMVFLPWCLDQVETLSV